MSPHGSNFKSNAHFDFYRWAFPVVGGAAVTFFGILYYALTTRVDRLEDFRDFIRGDYAATKTQVLIIDREVEKLKNERKGGNF